MNEKSRRVKKKRRTWIIGSIFLLIDDPAPLTGRLMADRNLPFTLTLVTNENLESTQLVAHRKAPLSINASETEHLNLAWPTGVISLSHVALQFPTDDPLYGQRPPIDIQALCNISLLAESSAEKFLTTLKIVTAFLGC